MFQPSHFKKPGLIFLDLLVFFSLGGAFYLQRLSEKKLGMIRWINFQSQRLEAFIPLSFLRIFSTLLVFGLLMLLLWRIQRQRRFRLAFLPSCLCGGLFLFLLFAFQREVLPSYYLLLAMNGLAFLFAWLRGMLAR